MLDLTPNRNVRPDPQSHWNVRPDPQSQRYYEKKRAEGKSHNQAIRALGRHLCRVIFKMLTMNRPYWIAK